MMWGKAMLFGDTEIAECVLRVGHPKQAEDFGRQVRGSMKSSGNPARWRGLNLLGFALMAARDELRAAQPELRE
jgi:predicted NAD-dependent protein-ADP-ribosyltransferase YbiA (DUF1768 family)